MKHAAIKKTAAVILCAALLFPFESTLRDGGTKAYTPITGAYRIYDYCGKGYSDEYNAANYGRHTVYVLGQMVFNDAKLPL